MEAKKLKAALEGYARQDLRLARKGGGCCVTDTKVGNIMIDYFPETREYSLYPSNGSSGLNRVKSKVAVAWLRERYAVVQEGAA